MYAQILLPLAVGTTFTYTVPPELAARVKPGVRVVVQFGARRYYTGIVTALSNTPPEGAGQLKAVSDVADNTPVVLSAQLKLWQWISSYYMCTQGEVMKAALPSGLKLESETTLLRNDDYVPSAEVPLTPIETDICRVLSADKGYNILAIEKALGQRALMRPIRHLMQLGAVVVRESMTHSFKPRTEAYVRLAPALFTEVALHLTLDALQRAPAQHALFVNYLDMAGVTAAVKLGNAQMLKPVTRHDLCHAPNAATALAALKKRGVLEVYAVETSRLRPSVAERAGQDAPMLDKPLSTEQQRAHDEIVAAFATKEVCLLHGVTSSGKTEVYTQLIKETLACGEQVLYLVPEIALTTQLTSRLERVFGTQMGVYHSKFPDAERVEMWQRQLTPEAFPLVVGVRSSLFLPFRRLGLVIVDEEHETSYKQQDPAPRYHARDTAIVMAHQLGAKVLLGTATPAIETYHNALSGKYGLVRMAHRYGGVELPEIVVEDVKELRRKRLMKSPFSPRLATEVRKAIEGGGQAILFQNRRGYAPVLECKACGWTPRCTRCDVSLTYHQRLGKLVCHYCGAQYSVPTQCPACGGTEMRDMGYGTEKIENEAAKAFPDARMERMDLDTTRSRTAYERIIHRFASGDTNLLIGTQMVTKGLDFDRVQVVGVLNADQMLGQPDFRAYERAYQMMSQVAGRAGRRGSRGLVVVQTKQADNPIIDYVRRSDYEAMYRQQLAERQAFGYPPFSRIISIYLKHRNDAVVDHAARHLAALLRPHFADGMLGPDRPVVARVQMQYIRKIMLKVPLQFTPTSVRRTLLAARDVVHGFDVYKSVTIYFDVE